MSADEKHFRRLNYCGTCKTMGALYGQKARLLLNHDTVFLAEMLSALSGEDLADWNRSYQSFNCLNLPKSEMPFALCFAATTNVILTEFKLADHVADEEKRRHKWMRNAFSKEFQQAEALLRGWNFPLEEVKAILDSQNEREQTRNSLDELAFPTAQTTALFFREGVRINGKGETENLASEIGFEFGKLIYLLDAFEDYEMDFRARRFNAFRVCFDLADEKLPPNANREITKILRGIEKKLVAKIHLLPIAERQISLFTSRLSQNLNRKLKVDLPVLQTKKISCVKAEKPTANRWQTATAKARSLAQNYSWQMPLVFLFVFAFALVAPAQTRETKSARECFDLSFNLMFLGAIFGSILAFPKPVLQKFPKRKKKQEEGENGGDNSGDSWCDCCDWDESCGCCCCDCGGCDCDCCGCDC